MNNQKTQGRVGAELIDKLYDREMEIFTLTDVNNLLKNNPKNNAELLHKMAGRNLISRLKAGKYIIIPQQYGVIKKYIGNRYVAAKALANSKDYYIAFYTAMSYWGMLTQPMNTTFVAVPKRQQPPKALKNEFRFVYVKRENIWGIKEEKFMQSEFIRVSDPERTIIDALAHPELCGGITEIAKGIWIKKGVLDFNKLCDYNKRYGKNVVGKRLGYLLEILELGNNDIFNELRYYVKDRYDVFDPVLPVRKTAKNSWRLIDNVGPQQIKNLIWS